MRSVFLLVNMRDREKMIYNLNSCCDQYFEDSPERQWNILKNGEGMFYIYEISAETLFFEMENKTYFDVINKEANAFACWQADISGRHDGTDEVKGMIRTLYSDIQGYVVDDYTNYFWTPEEIEKNIFIEGHPFFDINGWREENHPSGDSR